jgi:predicted O-linked N-acetylglucosamine transferase (SPINDLY family)
MDGRFMRGRLGSGILKRTGLQELVASTEEGYVALAVRLSKDKEYREHIRERIERSRHLLFEDYAPIRDLENFLAEATKRR